MKIKKNRIKKKLITQKEYILDMIYIMYFTEYLN